MRNVPLHGIQPRKGGHFLNVGQVHTLTDTWERRLSREPPKLWAAKGSIEMFESMLKPFVLLHR